MLLFHIDFVLILSKSIAEAHSILLPLFFRVATLIKSCHVNIALFLLELRKFVQLLRARGFHWIQDLVRHVLRAICRLSG